MLLKRKGELLPPHVQMTAEEKGLGFRFFPFDPSARW